MTSGIETGFALDRRWHLLRGEMERSKEQALVALARVLAEAGTRYAVIGGVALQVHLPEPRTTLDVDVAVTDLATLPVARLEAAGFTHGRRFEHSDNWTGPDGTPVQVTDDDALHDAIDRASSTTIGGERLRVIGREDLLREKLRSGTDPARRRSKRIQDLADAQALLEADPSLVSGLTPEQRALLDELI